MSTPRLRKHAGDEAALRQEFQSWAGKQRPPASARNTLLQDAARTRKLVRQPRLISRFQDWLAAASPARSPLPFSDLSQWMFSQSTWHHLGNDRRALRFVC